MERKTNRQSDLQGFQVMSFFGARPPPDCQKLRFFVSKSAILFVLKMTEKYHFLYMKGLPKVNLFYCVGIVKVNFLFSIYKQSRHPPPTFMLQGRRSNHFVAAWRVNPRIINPRVSYYLYSATLGFDALECYYVL